MTDHKHAEISWGIWAVLLFLGGDRSSGVIRIILYVFAVVGWVLMMWHGWEVDREGKDD